MGRSLTKDDRKKNASNNIPWQTRQKKVKGKTKEIVAGPYQGGPKTRYL